MDIEKVGTGTEDIIKKCRDYELKAPEFYQEEDFRVVIWRPKDYSYDLDSIQSDPGCSRMFQDVPDKDVELLNQIKENPAISRAKLAKALNISERQVRKITKRLKEKGVLVRVGGNS